MWHASIAVIGKKRTLSSEEVPESSRRIVIHCAKELLAGVGQFPSSLEQMQIAFHYRRGLTDAEYERLPATWCAIPAVHEAGHGMILEIDT